MRIQLTNILRTTIVAPSVAAFAICGISACDSPTGDSPIVNLDAQRPNVILVSLDTLRADHLGCYGYHRPTSPNIDALAKVATRYERCMTTAPWSLPAHASMLTGKPSFQHGAHRVRGPNGSIAARPIHEDEVSLAEVFRENGYKTAAFVANIGFLDKRFGFAQGFDTFVADHVGASELNATAGQWIREIGPEPFFLFLNFMDVHHPYNISDRPEGLAYPNAQNASITALYQAAMPAIEAPPSALVQALTDRYDMAINDLDAALGEFIGQLRTWGVFENTILVITSDHGEFFGEHYLVEHDKDVYQEVIHVPLVVKGVGQITPVVESNMVSISDIPAIIMAEFSGREIELHGAVFPDKPGNHPIVAQVHFSNFVDIANANWGYRFQRTRTAIFDWPHKLILSTGELPDELYDLSKDLGEAYNVATDHQEIVLRIRKTFDDFKKERGIPDAGRYKPVSESEQDKENLRALGYL